ncbi:hypothetical protein F3Y22_tig00116989pilonHSYRG00020 [Hibiscus syriacus]|uniref:RRM domain-containing protein n=1 Tax=Hibiscus syriacus TaxID=106335 RepID=A0A6A2WSE6_HIBSY|nr:hypothetical protein F3Y22_tig00116989pilonHSYRG00020 [Hibiscus syriacus]
MEETISLFVDNIPSSIHWKGLWQIVGHFGEVQSVYLPLKRSRVGSRFGFVKVGNMVEAERVKDRLNGLMVYGSRISVSFTKYYGKIPKDKCAQCKFSWKGNLVSPAINGSPLRKEASQACVSRKEVMGHVDEVEVRKLKRCLVGVMAGVCSVGSIVDRLHNWGLGDIKVHRLRGNSFLLTIEDEDLFIMLEDLQWSYLKEIFEDVMLWTESFCQNERVVWLEIDGIPLHCWNAVTLKRLVALWGRFEAFGDNVSHHLDCEKVNMLISTSSEVRIDEVVDVAVENKKFAVRVLEVRMADHSVGKLSKSEIMKKKEFEGEKDGIEAGAIDAGVSLGKKIDVPSVASQSGSSDGKKGSPSGGSPSDEACSGDSLGFRKNVSSVKPIEVGCCVEVGGEAVGVQTSDHFNHVGLQVVDIEGVENKAVESNVGSPFSDGVSLMEDRVLVSSLDVGNASIRIKSDIGIFGGFGYKERWAATYAEAEETLSVATMLGIKFAGPERIVLEELALLELCQGNGCIGLGRIKFHLLWSRFAFFIELLLWRLWMLLCLGEGVSGAHWSGRCLVHLTPKLLGIAGLLTAHGKWGHVF